jgi:hypothetical protein
MENIIPTNEISNIIIDTNVRKECKKEPSLPNKVVRRKKAYFPKGNHYKKYINAPWNWIDIFKHIEQIKSEGEYNFIRIISDKYGIKYGTLKNKYSKWLSDGQPNINKIENRGGHNKIFTEEQERKLYEWIP